ncbi:pentapeptide repeat-containing protein (plasmid) [Haloarcula salina]|uniref:pentapeptide repeat-containing protein n=1 Tax=Haloarcula salina TaxID=1429914 RepID=UPI003C6EA6AC
MAETPDRCSFEFDPAAWEQVHGQCFVYEDEDILTETENGTVVWQCPHEAISSENLCQFHLSADAAAKPESDTVVDELIAIVDGERSALNDDRPRQSRFIGATFDSLNLDIDQIGDNRCIDLRHAEIENADWTELAVRAEPLDVRGIKVKNWNCDGSTFGGPTWFDGAEFGGPAGFTEAEFRDEVTFDWAEFREPAWFTEVDFCNKTEFMAAEFGGPARFTEVEFGGLVRFIGTKFRGPAQFREVEFGESAWFNGAKFCGPAWFDSAEFCHGAQLIKAEFYDEARLVRAEFGDEARFKGTQFRGMARFREVEFDGPARFIETEFSGAGFTEAEFGEGAVFRIGGGSPASLFQDDADFSEITADAPVRFVDEYNTDRESQPYTFLGAVDFSGADIPNAKFSDVSFAEAPIFDGTDLTGADVSEIPLDGASFKGSDLIRTNLSKATVTNATFNDAVLERASLYGTDFRNARLYGARMAGSHVSDYTNFGIRDISKQRTSICPFRGPWPALRYDPRNPDYGQDTNDEDKQGGTTISDHSRAASVYTEIQRVAESNAASDLASRCFRWRKDMQRKRYTSDEGRGNSKNCVRRIWAEMANLVARYGDSPWRVVGTSIVTVILFSLVYPHVGGMQSTVSGQKFAFDKLFAIPENPLIWIKVLLANLYFSAVTFTTLGYGDIRPFGPVSQALASIESFLGAALLALLVAVLARRLTR